MRSFRNKIPVAVLMLAVIFAGCGRGKAPEGALTGEVRVDGSSTLYPITEAVAEEFMRAYPYVRVTVGISGTGGGFSKFLRGETHVNDASRTISSGELELAARNGLAAIELPVAYDGLAVVVSPENDFVECLTVEELRAIWEPGSEINNWNQVRPEFPNRKLALYGPGTDSGTYDYFTEAVMGESGASRADYTASEDDNVLVQGVAGDPSSLGFFGLAYYQENQSRLKLLGIDDEDPTNGEGCIQPSVETVGDGTYVPLSRPLLIYVREDLSRQEPINTFVEFYLTNAGPLSLEVGFIPLSDRAYSLAQERFDRGITGTMFGGESVIGVTMEELLQARMGESREPADSAAASGTADTTEA